MPARILLGIPNVTCCVRSQDDTRTTILFTRFDNTVECIFDGIPLGVVPEITADIVQPRGGMNVSLISA
eukprot:m.37882 g.37882  ORF g.37882 m.37882 type:complete len:69 (-) comp14601_c0_seq3:2476-2682(-)